MGAWAISLGKGIKVWAWPGSITTLALCFDAKIEKKSKAIEEAILAEHQYCHAVGTWHLDNFAIDDWVAVDRVLNDLIEQVKTKEMADLPPYIQDLAPWFHIRFGINLGQFHEAVHLRMRK